tara:strand:- start:22114 stop:22461 length:348 start_codon:yes stop_codon:yes gene_type:complete
MTRDEYIDLLKDTLQKQLLKSVYSSLLSKVTWLTWGPLGPLTKKMLEIVISIIIRETELTTYLAFTDFRTSRQGRKFLEASIKNQEAQRSEDPNAKKEAEKNLKDAFRDLIKLTN